MSELLDDQSLLVLYVAGELPESDRQEFERRLGADIALRGQVEELRSAHDLAIDSLSSLDGAQGLPQSQLLAAQRHTGRAMRQWQVERAVKKPAPAPRRQLKIGWGLYSAGLAAAAVLVIGVFVWWSNTYSNDSSPGIVKNDQPTNSEEDERLAGVIERSILTPGEVDNVEQAMAQVQFLGDSSRVGRSLWELQ